jgi:hypothetical protein
MFYSSRKRQMSRMKREEALTHKVTQQKKTQRQNPEKDNSGRFIGPEEG